LDEELLFGQLDGRHYSAEDDINSEPVGVDDSTETSSGILVTTMSLTTLRETIATLDALMTTLFNYVDPLFPTSDSDPTLQAEQVFDSLLSTFVSRILPTYHSRHAQFFLFRTSQSNPLFLDKYLGLLLERALDASVPTIARRASSAYLASFIARAKHITADTIRTVVEMLCIYLSRILESTPSSKYATGTAIGNQRLEGAYIVFQAVIYIYCFRWRELCEEDEELGGLNWLPELNVIQRMAWSGLNPLAVSLL
jgi:RNA polymerase I-specific transcription initiation factor RRN3